MRGAWLLIEQVAGWRVRWGKLRIERALAAVGLALGLSLVRALWLPPSAITSDDLSVILEQQQQNWEAELARLERAKREAAGASAMRSIVASLRSDLAEAQRRDPSVAP